MLDAFGTLMLFAGLLMLFFYLAVIALVIFIVSAAYNTAIMFAVQKILQKPGFSKLKAKQALWAIADITAANLLLYIIMLFVGVLLLIIRPGNVLFVLALEIAVIFALDFILIRFWEFGNAKQNASMALALAILNPFTIFYLYTLFPWIIAIAGLAVLAGIIIGAKIVSRAHSEKAGKTAMPASKTHSEKKGAKPPSPQRRR